MYKEFDVPDIGNIKIYKRKNSRNLRLSVTSDGSIKASIPYWSSYRDGLDFISSKRQWILKQHSLRSHVLISDGSRVGKSHHIYFQQLSTLGTVKTTVRSTRIMVTFGRSEVFSDDIVQSAARKACIRALRQQASTLLSQRLFFLAASHNLSYNKLSIKNLKSRWGSCDQNKNIVLNLYLVQLPWEFIDYVILHELTHTKVLNHGPSFWEELQNLQPNTVHLRKTIKSYSPSLLIA